HLPRVRRAARAFPGRPPPCRRPPRPRRPRRGGPPRARRGPPAPPRPPRAGGAPEAEAIRKQAAFLQLIRAYRVRGHLYAELDPLTSGPTPEIQPELAMSTYGLSVWDLERRFYVGNLRGSGGTMTLREVLEILRDTY